MLFSEEIYFSKKVSLILMVREGFLKTQQDMWGDLENWSKTGSGLPSTAGTTASIAFIRRGKIFVGNTKGVYFYREEGLNQCLGCGSVGSAIFWLLGSGFAKRCGFTDPDPRGKISIKN